MIKSIHLKNFGPHKDLFLELSPGVNVITGRSSVGKSWCSDKPIRLMFQNRLWSGTKYPPKDSFVYDPVLAGEKGKPYSNGPTEFELIVTDPFNPDIDRKITRFKSKSDHYYRIDDDEKQTFRSFGNSPPQAVIDILNLSDLNLQGQFDPIYLLSMNPSEVGRVLNEIAGLDLIDVANTRINSRLFKERGEKDRAKENMDKLKADLELYSGLGDLETRLMVCEELEKRSLEKRQRVSKIKSLVLKIQEKEVDLQQYEGLNQAREKLSNLQDKATKAKGLREEAGKIRKLLEQAKNSQSRYTRLEGVGEVLELVKELQQKALKAKGLRGEAGKIRKLIQDINQAEENGKSYHRSWALLHAEFDKLMPVTCPLCGHEQIDK